MYKFVKSIPKTIQATHDMIRNFLCNFLVVNYKYIVLKK